MKTPRSLRRVLFLLMLLSVGRWAHASTSGPSAPEVGAFTPVETGNLVNLATGQLTYSLPVIHVPGTGGGYSMSLGYLSGIRLDQEASWVGLGWSLQPGTITRSVVGVPDDFSGQQGEEKSFNTKADVTLSVGITLCDYFGVSGDYGFLSGDCRVGVQIESPIGRALERYSDKCFNEGAGIMSFSNVREEPRSAGIGIGGGGKTFSFGLVLNGNSEALNAALTNAMSMIDSPDEAETNVTLSGSFNISVSNRNKRMLGSYYLNRYGSITPAGDDVEMDFITERDGLHDKRVSCHPDEVKTAKYEGMIHLGQDLYSIHADGLSGSMKLIYSDEIILREALTTSFSLNASVNLPFDNIEAMLTSLPDLLNQVSVSGQFSKREFSGGAALTAPRFFMNGDSWVGNYKIDPVMTGNHLFQGFSIVNPKGDCYRFNHPVKNKTMFSWSSAKPPSETETVTTRFADLFSNGGEYSMGYNKNNNEYAYAWKLTELQRRDGTKVEFYYGNGIPEFYWRTPLRGIGPVMSVTETNRSQVSFGCKELDYLTGIETDTHFGYFLVGVREDAQSLNEDMRDSGVVNTGENLVKQHKLDSFVLFEKRGMSENLLAELRDHQITPSQIFDNSTAQGRLLQSKIRKRVEFVYDYQLCTGVPNSTAGNGKLTLTGLSISGAQDIGGTTADLYQFEYIDSYTQEYPTNQLTPVDCSYRADDFDRWGFYSPSTFTDRPSYYRHVAIPPGGFYEGMPGTRISVPASAAWSLCRVKTPLGTCLDVEYEGGRYIFSAENPELRLDAPEAEAPGGAPRVRQIWVRSSDTSSPDLSGTRYEYFGGATLREPRGYIGETQEDGGAHQDLDDPDQLQAWHGSVAPNVDLGSLRQAMSQNGSFCLPGPGIMYGRVVQSDTDHGGVEPYKNGYTESSFITPKELFQAIDLDVDYDSDDGFPSYLSYFRYIGINNVGNGCCIRIRIFGRRFTYCFTHNSVIDPGSWLPTSLLCLAHGQPLHLLCFGEDRGRAIKYFGPWGKSVSSVISFEWDVRKYRYRYNLVDNLALLGSKKQEKIYGRDSDDNLTLLRKNEFIYNVVTSEDEIVSVEKTSPVIVNYSPMRPTITDSLCYPVENYYQDSKSYTFGLAIAPHIGRMPPFDFGVTVIADTDIQKWTTKACPPLLPLGQATTIYDPEQMGITTVTEQQVLGVDPRTLQPVLTETSSPAFADRSVYTMTIPAFRLQPVLEEANLFGEVGMTVTGIHLPDGRFQPLRAKQTVWGQLPIGGEDGGLPIWTPLRQQVWTGAGGAHTLRESDNMSAWTTIEEIMSLDDQGQPREQRDAMGTATSVLKNLDHQVVAVAANARHGEVRLENFESPTVGTIGDGVTGRFLHLEAGLLPVWNVVQSNLQASTESRAVDLLVRGQDYHPNGLTIALRTPPPLEELVWSAKVPLSPVWMGYHVVIPPIVTDVPCELDIEITPSGELEPDENVALSADVDEIRMYPARALVKSFGYIPTRSSPAYIIDENAQATFYETTPNEELRSVQNMRRELLNLYYYRKQNDAFIEEN